MFLRLLFLVCLPPLVAFGQDSLPIRPGDKPAKVDDAIPPNKPAPKKDVEESKAAPAATPDEEKKAESPKTENKAPKAESSNKATPPASADDAEVPVVVIQSGDSLTKVSSQVYGNGGYHLILKHFNKCDPTKLKIGQVIKTPDLMWLLEKSKVVPLMADAVQEVMDGRKIFMEQEAILRKAAKGSGDAGAVEEGLKAQLLEAQKKFASATQKFNTVREGMKAAPASTSLQLRTVSTLIGELAAGKATKPVAKMDRVHTHLGNALVYAVIWAESGYK